MLNMIFRFKKIIALRRRRRFQHLGGIRDQLVSLTVLLLVVLALHCMAMMWLEGLSAADAIWLTLTTATTVGYGDLSAETQPGRIATVLLLYIAGIGLLAQVVAMYFEYRQEIRNRMLRGQWSWNMQDHIVFLNCPNQDGDEYYYQAISQLRASGLEYASRPIIIVSENFSEGLPERLRQMDVSHVSKPLSDQKTLNDACALSANTIIILSHDNHNAMSDSITFELISRLREMGFEGRIIAESVKDANRERLKRIGANNVLRPIRSYPELLMRAILAPGSEQVIEQLFDSFGEECVRYEVRAKGRWVDIISCLTNADIGLPLAYEAPNGRIVTNPPGKQQVDAVALFTIVSEGHIRPDEQVQRVLETK